MIKTSNTASTLDFLPMLLYFIKNTNPLYEDKINFIDPMYGR